jgi:hypothetical protein
MLDERVTLLAIADNSAEKNSCMLGDTSQQSCMDVMKRDAADARLVESACCIGLNAA